MCGHQIKALPLITTTLVHSRRLGTLKIQINLRLYMLALHIPPHMERSLKMVTALPKHLQLISKFIKSNWLPTCHQCQYRPLLRLQLETKVSIHRQAIKYLKPTRNIERFYCRCLLFISRQPPRAPKCLKQQPRRISVKRGFASFTNTSFCNVRKQSGS